MKSASWGCRELRSQGTNYKQEKETWGLSACLVSHMVYGHASRRFSEAVRRTMWLQFPLILSAEVLIMWLCLIYSIASSNDLERMWAADFLSFTRSERCIWDSLVSRRQKITKKQVARTEISTKYWAATQGKSKILVVEVRWFHGSSNKATEFVCNNGKSKILESKLSVDDFATLQWSFNAN